MEQGNSCSFDWKRPKKREERRRNLGLTLMIIAGILHFILQDYLDPISDALETLAYQVQDGSNPFGETIVAFCQEALFEGE